MAKPFETKIQDLVYNVDVGLGLKLIKFFLYALFVAVMLLLYSGTQFSGFREASAMENAQLARNFSKSGRLITHTVRPASIWLLTKNQKAGDNVIEGHPDLIHPPLYPIATALWLKALGTSLEPKMDAAVYKPEKMINFMNLLFVVLTGILVYIFGKRLFERRVAVLAVTVFFMSNLVWMDAISGLAVSMTMFLATAALLCGLLSIMSREAGGRFQSWFVPFAGSLLLAVAAFHTRYGAVVLLPALMLLYGVGFRQSGWMWSGLFLLVFLLGITPWLLRNIAVSGSPFGLAYYMMYEDAKPFEYGPFSAQLYPDLSEKTVQSALYAKWIGNMAEFFSNGANAFGNGLLVCLFVSTYFYRFVRFRVHLLRWCIALAGILLVVAAALFGEGSIRLMHMFWPLILLYGIAFFYLLLDRLQLRAKILYMLVTTQMVILCALPTIVTLLPPRTDMPNPPYSAPFISYVSSFLEPNELMCSDMPWATAWYGDRQSLELPVALKDFYEINDYSKKVSGIYFTMLTRNQPYLKSLRQGPYRLWFPIIEGKIPGDFPLAQGFPLKDQEQIFLTDRARWE